MFEGRWCQARPLDGADLPAVHRLLSTDELSSKLRFRGQTPPLQEFAENAWNDVLTQWVILDRRHRLVGLCAVTGPDFVDGVAWMSVGRDMTRADVAVSLAVVEGSCAVLDHAFRHWPLRRLYMEVPESSLRKFQSGADRFFEVEGVLKDRKFVDGAYEDIHILTMTNGRWLNTLRPWWERMRRESESR